MALHKRNNRFYNHEQERARSRIFNVAQIAWHIFVRRLLARRPPFITKETPLKDWIEKPDFSVISATPAVTWLGHASCLINIGGLAILTDPIGGPIGTLFKRGLPAPIPFDKLTHVDVILLSHNHRDHLDIPTLSLLKKFNPIVLVPEGDARLVRSIGFHRVYECSWHDLIEIETNDSLRKKIEFIFLPAIHWSGRGVLDVNQSLWGSWLIRAEEASIYFAGDSAYGSHFAEIAHRYGPPDIVLMPVAPEEPRNLMAPSHVGVEEALQAFDDLAGSHFFPIHWGTYAFGIDRFFDPIKKLQKLWPASQRLAKKLHIVPAGRVVIMDKL